MARTKQEQAPPLWLMLAFIGAGVFMIMVAADIISFSAQPTRRIKKGILDGYHHWQLTAAGIAFSFLGLSQLFGKKCRYASALSGMIGIAAFGSVLFWLICFSGKVEPFLQVVMGIVLLAGCGGAFAGLINRARGKEQTRIDTSDPIEVARVYAAWGRKAQARAMLEDALLQFPQRRAEIDEALRKLDGARRLCRRRGDRYRFLYRAE